MVKKLFMSIVIMFVFVITLQVANAGTVVAHYYNGMPRYKEDMPNWCWNATARMCAAYHYNVTKSQTDCAAYIFWPWGAQDWGVAQEDEVRAMEYYTDNIKRAGYTSSQCDFMTLANKLESSNNPIIMIIRYADGNHAVAAYGYDTINQTLAYVDPEGPFDREYAYDIIFRGSLNGGMTYFLDGQW